MGDTTYTMAHEVKKLSSPENQQHQLFLPKDDICLRSSDKAL